MDNPWQIDEQAYPHRGGSIEQLCFLANYALLAPSSHNTQPWRFVVEHEGLVLYADRSRRLPVVDPDDRELIMSCGAALGHLEVAIRRFGREPLVTCLPGRDDVDSGEPDRLAHVSLGGQREPRAEDWQLFSGVLKRRTTREVFSSLAVPPPIVDDLERIGSAMDIEMRTITSKRERVAIASLVAEGDRRQFADPAFRAELGAWIRSRRSARRDGVSAEGFDMPDSLSSIGALVIRTFDIGRGVAAHDEEIATGSPLLMVLASRTDDAAAWLTTGRVLSTLLLRAAASDVTASYLNQPIEVAALRTSLASLVGIQGHPQLLLRLGYSEHMRPSSRRALHDVLERPATAESARTSASREATH